MVEKATHEIERRLQNATQISREKKQGAADPTTTPIAFIKEKKDAPDVSRRRASVQMLGCAAVAPGKQPTHTRSKTPHEYLTIQSRQKIFDVPLPTRKRTTEMYTLSSHLPFRLNPGLVRRLLRPRNRVRGLKRSETKRRRAQTRSVTPITHAARGTHAGVRSERWRTRTTTTQERRREWARLPTISRRDDDRAPTRPSGLRGKRQAWLKLDRRLRALPPNAALPTHFAFVP